MGLSGLVIYKLLPKTNCKECGFPTCLAFAMKLAARQVELSACPYVSDEAKAQLDAASAPPIRLVTVGAGDRKVEAGNETVLFRHEKTFYHQPGIFYRLGDDASAEDFAAQVQEIADYQIERVGIAMNASGVVVENRSGDAATFGARVDQAVKAGLAVILSSENPAAIEAGLKAAQGVAPLIYAATEDNWEAMADLAVRFKAPLAVKGNGDLDSLAALAEKLDGKGAQDLVLDPGVRDWAGSLEAATQVRRLAIKKNYRALGYPIIVFPGANTDDVEEEALLASQGIAKYAGFVVLDHFDPAALYALLTLRQNIYTDPQKPIQVSPGLYEIGNPRPESPLLVTTNFSLTYFSVAGELEASGIPAWLLITDSEGMSVLTAWAAGKFDAERIAKAVNTMGVLEKVAHRKIIIPGMVSSISGDLEEELPGWQILVGPREAIGIPAFLKQFA
ncbi:MAG: acetyl-CoA decarbonylase/synthase complex subunit gamma [Chloroflexi bacterium]|jgi:acetyl-CoA decarbonylase/synthase complex subunit gamma|nr:acetyl-CoA decarbonylase/synthase complex subunit gamma [Chloroflexota bacterium]